MEEARAQEYGRSKSLSVWKKQELKDMEEPKKQEPHRLGRNVATVQDQASKLNLASSSIPFAPAPTTCTYCTRTPRSAPAPAPTERYCGTPRSHERMRGRQARRSPPHPADVIASSHVFRLAWVALQQRSNNIWITYSYTDCTTNNLPAVPTLINQFSLLPPSSFYSTHHKPPFSTKHHTQWLLARKS